MSLRDLQGFLKRFFKLKGVLERVVLFRRSSRVLQKAFTFSVLVLARTASFRLLKGICKGFTRVNPKP